MDPVWIAVVGVAGTIAGGAFAVIGQYVVANLKAEREDRRASKRREMEIHDRRTSFQRETLLSLQDALDRLLHVTFEVHAANTPRVVRRPLSAARYPPDLFRRFITASATANKYLTRVQDHDLRATVSTFIQATLLVPSSTSVEESAQRCRELSAAPAFGGIGAALRELY